MQVSIILQREKSSPTMQDGIRHSINRYRFVDSERWAPVHLSYCWATPRISTVIQSILHFLRSPDLLITVLRAAGSQSERTSVNSPSSEPTSEVHKFLGNNVDSQHRRLRPPRLLIHSYAITSTLAPPLSTRHDRLVFFSPILIAYKAVPYGYHPYMIVLQASLCWQPSTNCSIRTTKTKDTHRN